MFVRVRVDTDPENMLPADAEVRVLNAEIREELGTADMIVVGIFADGDVVTADRIGAAVTFHDSLSAIEGVDETTMVSVRTAIDGQAPSSDGQAPSSDADARALAEEIAGDPLLGGNVISDDGDTLAFFVPLDDKSDAQAVRDAANDLLDDSPQLAAFERHIAGLPLA